MTLLTLRYCLVSVLVTLTLNSCQEAKLDLSDDALTIKVDNSSGDDFSYQDSAGQHFFAPYPFPQGKINIEDEAYEVIILSKKLKKGATVGIKPLAQFTVRQPSGVSNEVIVVVPTDTSYQLFDMPDFFGFMVENFALKQILDHWYANKNGLEGTLVENWRPANIPVISS